MNPGVVALLTLVGCIGSGIAVVWYRDLIFPQHEPPARRTRPGPRRPPAARPTQVKQAEIKAKRPAIVSSDVSRIATPEIDVEMIAAETIALLVAAKLVTETRALETVFSVKAGKSKDYIRVQEKFKTAQAQLDKMTQN